jgi:hypothetical protein
LRRQPRFRQASGGVPVTRCQCPRGIGSGSHNRLPQRHPGHEEGQQQLRASNAAGFAAWRSCDSREEGGRFSKRVDVTCDDKAFLLGENQGTDIPLGSKHRMRRPGQLPLALIEVQPGSYPGEDDIYGRP